MWMMGCNDGGDQLRSIQDSFNGRKLRPFMPITAAATRNHGTDHFLALNHHFVMAEQNRREFSTQQVVVSSRWNPTPEQLQTLEELYRRGVRTPSAEQIQHITAQLRRYGKIEGKNVFYWFQNHKARERQKRRRQLDQEPHDMNQIPNVERKKQSSAGENGTVFEVEQTCKKLASPNKSSTTIAVQKNMPTREAEGNKADGWVQFNEETESEERRNPSNWRTLQHLSYSSPSPNNLINYSFPSSATVDTNTTLKHQHFRSPNHCGGGGGAGGGCAEEQTTLQLFPLRSGCRRPCEEEEDPSIVAVNYSAADVAPDYQFFEFLPLKK